MDTINVEQYHNIVVLTGAGISVASGLPSYRGPEGLWQDEDVAQYALAETWETDPLGVWQAFASMRAAIAGAVPNAAHRALADLERRLPADASFHLITQNVDGLHQAAGSAEVIELHGNLHFTRCNSDECASAPFRDTRTSFDELPICEVCGGIQRPNIVLFGEWIPAEPEHRSRRALRDCDLFIAVGTSGTVTPASNFVRGANYVGARTILVNLEPMEPANPYFDEEILGRAEDVLVELFGA